MTSNLNINYDNRAKLEKQFSGQHYAKD